jgi:CelD/BcsL family acetyltransferase involved in cellulose biosynthesis
MPVPGASRGVGRALMAVHTLDPLEDPRWTDLLARDPSSSVFHTPGWLEALRRTYGYEPVVLTTSPQPADLANGLVFCHVRSWLTGRRMVSLPFSDHCQPLVGTPEHLAELATAWKQGREEQRCRYLELRPVRLQAGWDPGFGTIASYAFHALDLRPDLDTIYRGFHKSSVQRKIRRAEREGLAYEVGRTPVLVEKFYHLLLLTRRRFKVPPQPLGWFRNLAACLGDHAQVHVASRGRRPVAAILTLSHKKTLVYKYGCSDSELNHLGANALLFWKAIQAAKAGGAEELDMGRSDWNNTGLITFKSRWGATLSSLSYLGYPESARAAWGFGWRAGVAPLLSRAPMALQPTMGRLLYRHLG